ncbi:hypothetical protein [Streptomyces sp. NPDC018045]
MIAHEHRAKGPRAVGAKSPGQIGPYGPYGGDQADEEDQDQADEEPTR